MSTQTQYQQPLSRLNPPKIGQTVYFAVYGAIWNVARIWDGGSVLRGALDAGIVYETAEARDQALAWFAEQVSRVRVPDWYLALGADVEYLDALGNFHSSLPHVADWTKADNARYRSKPREVVTTVNGVEFRWPETCRPGGIPSDRYFVNGVVVRLFEDSSHFGEHWHHAREGAEAQLAAMQAAAKGVTK